MARITASRHTPAPHSWGLRRVSPPWPPSPLLLQFLCAHEHFKKGEKATGPPQRRELFEGTILLPANGEEGPELKELLLCDTRLQGKDLVMPHSPGPHEGRQCWQVYRERGRAQEAQTHKLHFSFWLKATICILPFASIWSEALNATFQLCPEQTAQSYLSWSRH